MQKFIAVAIIIISVAMLIIGRVNDRIGYIIFGVIGFIAGIYILVNCFIENSPIHDEKTNRFYRYAKTTDNPNRAMCPKCKPEYKDYPLLAVRPLIHSVYGDKKYHGVYCWHHGEVWFDKEEKDGNV